MYVILHISNWILDFFWELLLCHFFFSLFAPLFSLFTFHSILHQGWHSCEKSKDFTVYFFTALIKHKTRMKYENNMVSVSYYMVCFAKTLVKYPQNAKYKKCTAISQPTNITFLLGRRRFFILFFFFNFYFFPQPSVYQPTFRVFLEEFFSVTSLYWNHPAWTKIVWCKWWNDRVVWKGN